MASTSGFVRGLMPVPALIGFVCALFAPGDAGATTLWSNGAVVTNLTGDNRCDSGPNTCGGKWTVFDNFNVPTLSLWSVNGFDFTDFLSNMPISDYTSTTWVIFAGDPLSGGTKVASGTSTASLSNISGTCGNGSTCLEQFSISGLAPIVLGSGTYYLGTSNTISVNNPNEATLRAFAAGGNTAPNGTPNPLAKWEQSNGTVSGNNWTAGSTNNSFPGALGLNEGATAFEITSTPSSTPEPGAFLLVSSGIFGVLLARRARRG